MAQINWEVLISQLESGNCILCLGPDIYSVSEKQRLEHQLAETLRAKSEELGVRVYDDGWFHYVDQHDEVATWLEIKTFYEKKLPTAADALLRKIATLPFSLILNFSPDYKLRDAFVEEGEAHEFRSLLKDLGEDEETEHKLEASIAKPLLFNMLGELENKDSIVMTYDDLFSYMKAVFENKRLPKSIQNYIKKATYIIFLGMPLDKWYFHLFMRLIDQHKIERKPRRYLDASWIDEHNATLCKEQYTLSYISNGIEDFLGSLSTAWEEKLKKEQEEEGGSVFDQWRKKMEAPDSTVVQKVLAEIRKNIPSGDSLMNDQILMTAQWNVFEATPFETEMAKKAVMTGVINGILNLIDQLEETLQIANA